MGILCATDFSGTSLDALHAGAAISTRLGGEELSVVHVLGPEIDRDLELQDRQLIKEHAAARLEAEVRRLRERFPRARARAVLLTGSASERLAEQAARDGASLVIASSQGHGSSSLFRLGGCSERLAATSTVPVLIVRDAFPFTAWAEGRHLRLVVGVDPTRSSDAALRLVKLLRAAGPCDVVVAHVYHGHEALAHYGLDRSGHWMDPDPAAEALMTRDLHRQLGELGGEGTVEILPYLGVGRLGDHLLEVATSRSADLVVVGSHQPRGFRRMSSVSSVVLHYARMSVAMVPASWAGEGVSEASPVRRVLVMTDLSSEENRVVARAYDLLAGRGGDVHVLHVTDAAPGAREDELRAKLRALEPAWAAREDVVTRIELGRGEPPAEVACATAARVGADVICVAARHAEAVVRRSDRPVLVVGPRPL